VRRSYFFYGVLGTPTHKDATRLPERHYGKKIIASDSAIVPLIAKPFVITSTPAQRAL
jgi:hypothetical protein